jgi:hypothetical protein
MIWLTWRHHRRQALFTALGLAVLAALMIPTGLMMHTRSPTTGCRRASGRSDRWGS